MIYESENRPACRNKTFNSVADKANLNFTLISSMILNKETFLLRYTKTDFRTEIEPLSYFNYFSETKICRFLFCFELMRNDPC